MSDVAGMKPPLGVFDLIGNAFSLVMSNLAVFLPIALVPAALSLVLGYLTSGPASLNSFLAFTDPQLAMESSAQLGSLAWFAVMAGGILLWGFIMAAVTRTAYDLKANGAASVQSGLSTGLKYMLPLIPIIIVVGIATYVGFALFIVPGLYLMGLWFVVVPVFVIEAAGFGSLGRSATLTEGYRWPMVGMALMFLLIFIVFGLVVGFLQYFFWSIGTVGLLLSAVVTMAMNALVYSIGSTIAALAYARLREIKEDAPFDTIAEIFR
ncbi:MAG: hypothetical protein AAF439_07575, partial [Pseudomonadota bacterium]